MKKNKNLLLLLPILAIACTPVRDEKHLSEPDWGKIPNSSVENVQSSVVIGWNPLRDRSAANHFYSYTAHEGSKSLSIQSMQPAYGNWSCKVPVKPWSKYKFTGWIKTENIDGKEGEGATFKLGNFPVDFARLNGTNDWTEISGEFETGNDDGFILECLFNTGGRSTGTAWFDDMNLELVSSEKIVTDIIVDAAVEKEPMSEYIYGQFIEHLGKCIYGGIWAEMIDDRKFWYEPGTPLSPWKIDGDKNLIQMDKNFSFVGEQTPIIISNDGSPVSLRQDGLGIRKDINLDGRVVLKATGKIDGVKIRLIENNTNQDLIDEVIIKNLTSNYNTYPITLNSNRFTENATIQILTEGTGKVWLGTISLMPADNVKGFRADVLELLKGLNSPVYRWPGGNFVSGYDWRDGIGDPDKRPPRKNPAWSGVEHNDVGMHEFMDFCELLGTEPYIAVNAGLGGAEEAANQVEYCNGNSETAMGKLRSENGNSEPWHVKWWSVGNEMYGSWQLGHMDTKAFVEKHNEFAKSMRAVDSSIKLVAVGNLGDWDRMILSNSSDNMDLISEHFYTQDWHGGGLMTHIRQVPDNIRLIADQHRKYREEIPALKGKDIQIAMDEWNYWYGPHIYGELGTRYFLRDGLGIAAGINEFSKNSDIIYMANYAQTVNVIGCIKTSTTNSVYATTGMVLKMYREHFGTIPVEVSGETRPFDVAATLSENRDTLVVSIINQTWEEQKFKLNLKNIETKNEVDIYTITGPDDMAYNEPGREESVKIDGPLNWNKTGSYSVKPYSATLMVFAVARNP